MLDFSDLNYVDYFVLSLVVLSTLFAFIRGFIGSFLSLGGWILSGYLTYILFPVIKPLIDDKIANPVIALLAGHGLLFVALLIVFGVINLLIGSSMRAFIPSVLDRTLGLMFGVIRGIIIVSFIFLMVTFSISIFNGSTQDADEHDLPKWLTTSKTYPFIRESSSMLTNFIPSSFYSSTQKMYQDVSKKTLEERFLDSMLQKLRKSINPKTVDTINKKIEVDSIDKTSEELKLLKLRDYLTAYQKNQTPASKFKITNQDLERLNKVLANKTTPTHQSSNENDAGGKKDSYN